MKVSIGSDAETVNDSDTNGQTALASVIARLSTILQQENAVLDSPAEANHEHFICVKNQVLRELMLLQQSQQLEPLSPAVAQTLLNARKLVDRNSHLLKLQASAQAKTF
jgi:hypothetical protein